MALEKMLMPQLGESVTEGTISKWLVAPGDSVKKYEPLAEVMTDKVTAEIPSAFSGTVREIVAREGETLPVGAPICLIETEGEGAAPPSDTDKPDAQKGNGEEIRAGKDGGEKRRYSPAVLKLSQEYGIDLSEVKGTGRGGRITRKDLLRLIESRKDQPAAPVLADGGDGKAPERTAAVLGERGVREETPAWEAGSAGDLEIPVSGIRRAIAQNMSRSKREIPHAWTMVEVDVTNLVALRDSIKEEFERKEGFKLTYFPFFVKAVAQALKEFPQLNAVWAGDRIIRKRHIHISVAVATEDALYVPVIKHADEKTVKGIAREIHELARKARNGTLKLEDVEGGTFTVNNTGSFGSVQSMGIINYPQAAILQVETIVKRPVIRDGMIAIRDMVNLCLSLDHRVLDGLICGRFLMRLKEILENISKENTSVY
ncbi:MAG: branched-chain alpha-keto acid dehydrogenase subunit E2 [Caldibacillus debilis]|uniref:Dihydrolipoamide acetyltransferase component of pyruvate dehydrogenase complex n=1 Tax=Caldibacillus debilis TaxID=301148 RepID=A0A3E0K2G2_9BACI|nr:dihydrolipoamide acetyltransferase family protein [Caldibacillus debilis]REJ27217.1 MAG: branched-chain alpha-keto acid dehydrogenase subunit E2 [Caldibacillus debilis]